MVCGGCHINRVRHANHTGPREPWDFGRFVKTVLFFNEPPPLPKLLQSIASAPLKLLQGVSSGDLEVRASEAPFCQHHTQQHIV